MKFGNAYIPFRIARIKQSWTNIIIICHSSRPLSVNIFFLSTPYYHQHTCDNVCWCHHIDFALNARFLWSRPASEIIREVCMCVFFFMELCNRSATLHAGALQFSWAICTYGARLERWLAFLALSGGRPIIEYMMYMTTTTTLARILI